MNTLKKVFALALALALLMPVVTATRSEAAKKKAPQLQSTYAIRLPEATGIIEIIENDAKIIKTTWKVGDKNVATLSEKSKTSVNYKCGGAGDTSTKITATVKYKLGKKVKTKKLNFKLKVEWLSVDRSIVRNSMKDDNPMIICYLSQYANNINPYDIVPNEGEIEIRGGWKENVGNVVEITDGAGNEVKPQAVLFAGKKAPMLWIHLDKQYTEKTDFNITIKGFEGCGSKSIIQTNATIDPKKVTLTQEGYLNPEKKGNISMILNTDVPFTRFILPEFDQKEYPILKVTDDKGTEVPVTDVIVTTNKVEGDQLVINLKGGADSKKFTIEFTNSLFAYVNESENFCYLAEKTVVVDKPILFD